jgi:hypothetical protein
MVLHNRPLRNVKRVNKTEPAAIAASSGQTEMIQNDPGKVTNSTYRKGGPYSIVRTESFSRF